MDLLKYCIVEICVNIHPSAIEDLHQDLTRLIQKYENEKNLKNLILTLQSLNEYFGKTTIYNVSKAQDLVVETISLISHDSAEKATVYQLLGDFLTVN